MSIRIEFEPVGRRGPCSPGGTLLDCARQLGVDLVNLCGGAGSCGRCRVQVLAGRVSELTAGEQKLFSASELAEGYRLACRAVPLSDCKVRVPPDSLTTPQRTQVEGIDTQVVLDPPVQVHSLRLPEPSLDDLRADAERLVDALPAARRAVPPSFDLACLQGLSPWLRQQAWHVDIIRRDQEIVACLAAAQRPLGLAVDLGTTKIAAYLVDLTTGATLASDGFMNPQIAYGEDVIARMAFAGGAPAQAARMQALIVDALNQALVRLGAQAGCSVGQVVEAVVVGNTAMHHLFLHLPVEQLARAPYVPAVRSALDVKARDLGLRIAPGAYVHLLPNIAGYVGADHVAMLLATGMDHVPGVALALDIGTNTEVCLSHHGRLTSLSCASGPAFEGAHIRHGMRAANGAIEHVRLVGGRVEVQTIGAQAAVGLCGSGILDTLAQLFQAGVVDTRGRMLDHPRVRGAGGDREFVLVAEGESGDEHRDITFTQKDVRELQLAKGAMRTGIQVLLETAGLEDGAIDQVIIAGAFGTYIDVSSAIAIGMLPPLPLERFRQVGNAAGTGARMVLVSQQQRAAARRLADRVGYVELATVPQFATTFARSMFLGTHLFR